MPATVAVQEIGSELNRLLRIDVGHARNIAQVILRNKGTQAVELLRTTLPTIYISDKAMDSLGPVHVNLLLAAVYKQLDDKDFEIIKKLKLSGRDLVSVVSDVHDLVGNKNLQRIQETDKDFKSLLDLFVESPETVNPFGRDRENSALNISQVLQFMQEHKLSAQALSRLTSAVMESPTFHNRFTGVGTSLEHIKEMLERFGAQGIDLNSEVSGRHGLDLYELLVEREEQAEELASKGKQAPPQDLAEQVEQWNSILEKEGLGLKGFE